MQLLWLETKNRLDTWQDWQIKFTCHIDKVFQFFRIAQIVPSTTELINHKPVVNCLFLCTSGIAFEIVKICWQDLTMNYLIVVSKLFNLIATYIGFSFQWTVPVSCLQMQKHQSYYSVENWYYYWVWPLTCQWFSKSDCCFQMFLQYLSFWTLLPKFYLLEDLEP